MARHLARLARLAVVFAVLLFVVAGAAHAQRAPQMLYAPGEVLIGLPGGARLTSSRAYATKLELTAGRIVQTIPAIGAARVKLNPGLSVSAAIRKLLASGLVTYAEPNYRRSVCTTPNDTYYSSQYAPHLTQADAAWDIWTPLSQVVIAIVDTGIDGTHPDLTNKMLRSSGSIVGYNGITGTPGAASDDHGHGTHCAGIAAAEINNGTGVAGIAGWNPTVAGSNTSWVRLMPIKVLDSSGSGYDSWIAAGITWAVDNGANVISMSLGGAASDTTLDNAVQYAWAHNVVVVAASGNSGVNSVFYPAGYNNVLSVGATDSSDTMTSFSNYGSWVSMVAPGASILSTTPTYSAGAGFPLNYCYLDGTSMACPHVSGAAALIMAQNPTLTNAQVVNLLLNNTDPYTLYPGHAVGSVHGRLNVYKALFAAGNGGPPSAPTGLIAASGNTRVGLQWSATMGAASYTLKRATVSGGPYTTVQSGLTTTQYIDSGLTNGTTYYYVVSATNLAGTSANSTEASVTPTATVRLNCGGLDYISATTGLWDADNYYTGGSTVTYSARTIAGTTDSALYLPVRYTGTSFTYTIPVSAGTYTLKLYFAEMYYTSAGQRVCNVTANGSPVLTNFDAYTAAGGINKATVQSAPVTAGAGGLAVTVSAVTGYPNLSAIEVVPAAPSAPAAPTALTATASLGQISLAWTGSVGASSYNVYRGTATGGPYVQIATGQTATTYADTAVSTGTTYYYVVTAVNGVGESGYSNEASATPATSLKINCGGGAYVSGSTGTWMADSYFTGGSVASYSARTIAGTTDAPLLLAERYTNTSFTYNLPVAAGSYVLKLYFTELYYNSAGQRICNVSVNGTQVLTNYDVFAAAGGANILNVQSIPVTVAGSGGISLTVSAVVGYPNLGAIEVDSIAPVAPSAPTGLTAVGGNAQTALSWTAGTGAATYNVKRATVTGGPYSTIATGVTGTSYTDSTAANGTTYYYVVSATNAYGTSSDSNEASATPAFALRINCGGGAYTGSTGVWQADTYFTGGATCSYSARTIAGTSDGALYLDARYTNTSFTYNLPVSAGTYALKLHFAELYYTSAGQRVCNVSVNGAQVLTNFDAFTAAGGANKATVQSIPVTVGGSGLAVTVTAVVGYPNLCAIEVVPATPTAPSAPTGLTATGTLGQVALAWNSNPAATSYAVKRATVSGGPYTTIASGLTSPSYADTGGTNGTTYYYVVNATNAVGTSPDSSEASAAPSAYLRINCGGGAYVSGTTGAWMADAYYTGGSTASYSSRTITGTTDGPLFLDARYSGTSFGYNLPVPAGSYHLKLFFAELYYSSAGQRVCNVTVNGSTALTNYDVFAAAGGMNILNTQTIPVTVAGSGGIQINVQSVVGYPNLAAIEVGP